MQERYCPGHEEPRKAKNGAILAMVYFCDGCEIAKPKTDLELEAGCAHGDNNQGCGC